MRILVTNDDGIFAPGIQHLARAMDGLGEIVVIAPDQEFSGSSAAIGAIWESHPHVTRYEFDGVAEAWALNGPPALCAMYARFGAFGAPFDLIVSGINPGANVGRSVYHSGTIGACLSGRNGGIPGIAVSQAAAGWGVEGQAWHEVLKLQKWETAAAVARAFVEGFVAEPPADVVVANINVPNVELAEIEGWSHTEVGMLPPRSMSRATLVPRKLPDGTVSDETFDIEVAWGDADELPEHTDGGAVARNRVSVTYLTKLQAEHRDDLRKAESALDRLLGGG
jgi:5'-nucleotidase